MKATAVDSPHSFGVSNGELLLCEGFWHLVPAAKRGNDPTVRQAWKTLGLFTSELLTGLGSTREKAENTDHH